MVRGKLVVVLVVLVVVFVLASLEVDPFCGFVRERVCVGRVRSK